MATKGIVTARMRPKGASIYDIRKILDFLTPCPHLDLIYTIKFMLPPFPGLIFHDPPLPLRCEHTPEATQGMSRYDVRIGVGDGGHGKVDVLREVS